MESREKTAKSFILNKKAPLLDRLTTIYEVGIMDKESLAYFRDERFLYLFDILNSEIKQRVRYSTFKKILPYSVNTDFLEKREPSTIPNNIFGKFDKKSVKLELFELQDNSIKDIQDIDLKARIQETLDEKNLNFDLMAQLEGVNDNDLIFDRLDSVKLAETKAGQLTLLSYIFIKPQSEAQKTDSKYLCLMNIDVDSLETESSIVFPCSDFIGESIVRGKFGNWVFDPYENFWHFLEPTLSVFDSLRRNEGQQAASEKQELLHCWIGSELELHREVIKLGDQVEDYFQDWDKDSGRVWKDRLYVKHRPRQGDHENLEEITVLERSEDSKNGGYSYSKLNSVEGPRHGISFVGGYADLRLVFLRSEKSDQNPEIIVTDRDLIVTHKLILDQLCGNLREREVVARTLPSLLAKKWIVLSLFTEDEGFNDPKYVFLIDLSNFKLIRMIRETGVLDEKEVPGEECDVEDQANRTIMVSKAGPNFLMLDDCVYLVDE